jgi:hypothetical protein
VAEGFLATEAFPATEGRSRLGPAQVSHRQLSPTGFPSVKKFRGILCGIRGFRACSSSTFDGSRHSRPGTRHFAHIQCKRQARLASLTGYSKRKLLIKARFALVNLQLFSNSTGDGRWRHKVRLAKNSAFSLPERGFRAGFSRRSPRHYACQAGMSNFGARSTRFHSKQDPDSV